MTLLAAGCEGPTDAERCADIEERLSAELQAQPVTCRQDEDCHPVQMHCKAQAATSTAPPISITRLSKQFEDLGCCGGEAVWDGFTPKELPEVGCVEGPIAEDGTAGANVCAVRNAVTCGGACQVISSCEDRDVDSWGSHDDGCEPGCSEALAGHPARTRRLVDCIAVQGCGGAGDCL